MDMIRRGMKEMNRCSVDEYGLSSTYDTHEGLLYYVLVICERFFAFPS